MIPYAALGQECLRLSLVFSESVALGAWAHALSLSFSLVLLLMQA